MAIDWRVMLSTGCALGLLVGCADSDTSRGAADGGAGGHRAGSHSDEDAGSDDSDSDDKPATGGAGGSKASNAGAGGKGGSGGSMSSAAGAGGSGDKPAAEGGAHFFLPTIDPTNTTAPKLLADAKGGTHMVYPTYGSGGAFYAYCGDGCSSMDEVKPVHLATEGVTDVAALALTQDGKPRAILSTFLRVYYAECNDKCTEEESWTVTPIIEHNGDLSVTGQALALDPDGHPRFIMHTYLAYLGVGQKPKKTYYVTCDSDCNSGSSWEQHEIDDEKIWYGSELQIDAKGRAHVLTGVDNADGMSAGLKLAAYLECDSGCTSKDDWNGIGLQQLYENTVSEVHVSLSLALTHAGNPRLMFLGSGGDSGRQLLYFECDDQCTEDNWHGTILSDMAKLGEGVDLVMDAKDHPRFVFTLDDNIGFYRCDADSCTAENADWQLTKVEFAGEVPKDNIILWPNCTVDLWILHTPSLAFGKDGSLRVGYQATDLSGGTAMPDPTSTGCVAGKDMVLSRLSLMAANTLK